MAAERIYGRGLSPNNIEYTATFWDTDYVGDPNFVEIEYGGIRVDWQTDKGDDPLWPIYGSVAKVDMLLSITDTDAMSFVDDVRTSKEGRFFLEITTNGAIYPVVWRGIVTPDTLSSEVDQGPVQRYSLSAVCGLGLLKTVPYYNAGTLYTGRASLIAHLTNALKKLSHVATFWGATDPFLETSADWWDVTMTSGGANDPFNLTRVDHAAFYDYNTKGGVDKDVISCYDVIRNICTTLGCRILQRGGLFVVEQIDYRATATTYEYRRYDKSGAATSNGSYTGVNTINQTKTSGAKLSYVEYDYLPQLAKTAVTYESRLRRNLWGNILLSEGTTFNFNQDISSNSGAATFKVSGIFFVTVKNNTYSGNPQDVIIPEMRLMLKVGSNYLKRAVTFANFAAHYEAMSWTSTSSDRVSVVSQGQQVPASGLSSYFVQPFSFITPALPSDGDTNSASATFFQLKKNDGSDVDESQFTITWTAGSMWLEVYESGTPDVQEDQVLYESTNPDEGTDIWEVSTLLGGGGTSNYAGRITNAAGTELNLWGQGTGDREHPIGQLLGLVAQNGRLRTKKRLNGQLFGNALDPRKLIRTSDSIDWLDTRLNWRMTENILEGTFLECDYGTTAAPQTPIKVKVITGGTNNPQTGTVFGPTPTTGGNQGFASNNPPAVLQPLAFNTLATPITKGAAVTSIAVNTALEGNEFLVGDNIVIVHPVSGQYQTFAVSAAPGSGATSISVTSATALFDTPQYAGLFIQQKAYAFSLPPGTHEGSILRWDDVNEVWEPYDGTTDGHVLTWDTTNGWQAEASSGGGLADGDKGDITVSSSGTVWTIDNNVVTFAKFQQIPTDRLLGRDTDGTGNITTISLDTTLEFAGGDVIRRASLTGDVTATAGSNATTIANDAVTDAKLRNSAALSVIGRATNTTGDPADIPAGTDAHVLRRSGTNLGFGQVATGGIADDAVTLAKLQNSVSNNIVLGNVAGAGQPYVELTVAQLQTLLSFVDGAGTANRLAYWQDSNTLTSDAAFTVDGTNDRMTILFATAGNGAGNGTLNLTGNAAFGVNTEIIRAVVDCTQDAGFLLSNTRNTSNLGSAYIEVATGGATAADPYFKTTVTGQKSVVWGQDNSAAGDPFRITPDAVKPGSVANRGLTITTDAVSLIGVNLDAPKFHMDVAGRTRSSTGFIGKGNQWSSSNIGFASGAGTGATVDSISGCDNAFYLTFTTGTSPANNSTIFTATYPNAFPSTLATSFVTWSPADVDAASEITKFRLGNRSHISFQLVANGTLTASTQYSLCFIIWSMDS